MMQAFLAAVDGEKAFLGIKQCLTAQKSSL